LAARGFARDLCRGVFGAIHAHQDREPLRGVLGVVGITEIARVEALESRLIGVQAVLRGADRVEELLARLALETRRPRRRLEAWADGVPLSRGLCARPPGVSVLELCAGPAIKAQLRALVVFLETAEDDVSITPAWW
jgi:hypothetical protein